MKQFLERNSDKTIRLNDLFNSKCPYTNNYCDTQECEGCKVEQIAQQIEEEQEFKGNLV